MLITQVCRITHHPITYCNEKIKEQYVMGLGNVLYHLSNGHPNMAMLFGQWGYSIMGRDVSAWFRSDDEAAVKRALALHRNGWRFFRLKHQFYFDCFYLTETFDKSLLDSLYSVLKESGSNVFTNSSLENTYRFFKEGNTTLNAGDSLLRHRSENLTFSSEQEKRILVVATVSAGKSTLINALTGHPFSRVRNGVCTTHKCTIHNKRVRDGITFNAEGKFVYSSDIASHSSDDIFDAAFHFESTLGDKRICVIDTPGVNNSQDPEHFQITSDAIKSNNYDLIIFVSNGQYNGTNDERCLLDLLHSATDKPILFGLNQLDQFKNKVDDIGKMICDFSNELINIGFNNPVVFPLSARYAYLLRTEQSLDEDEVEELDLLKKRFSKEYLNLQGYAGQASNSEIEKTGIILLEEAIKKQITNN